jgi:hypothetical protein
MWRSKKFIIIAVFTAVLLVGTIGGVALAQTEDEDNNPQAQREALLDRVCEIYEENTGTAINAEALQEAIAQAQSETQAAAMEARLAKMVENGVLDEAQAQELLEWWEARPDVPVVAGWGDRGMPRCGFGGPGGFGPPSSPEGFEPPE